jgi:hypothetical protein
VPGGADGGIGVRPRATPPYPVTCRDRPLRTVRRDGAHIRGRGVADVPTDAPHRPMHPTRPDHRRLVHSRWFLTLTRPRVAPGRVAGAPRRFHRPSDQPVAARHARNLRSPEGAGTPPAPPVGIGSDGLAAVNDGHHCGESHLPLPPEQMRCHSTVTAAVDISTSMTGQRSENMPWIRAHQQVTPTETCPEQLTGSFSPRGSGRQDPVAVENAVENCRQVSPGRPTSPDGELPGGGRGPCTVAGVPVVSGATRRPEGLPGCTRLCQSSGPRPGPLDASRDSTHCDHYPSTAPPPTTKARYRQVPGLRGC